MGYRLRVLMLALTLGLVSQDSVAAAELTVVQHCGVPVLYIGTLDGTTIYVTQYEVKTYPVFAEFLSKIIRELTLINIEPQINGIKIEQISGIHCPIRV
jgi:hypothetical protein